MLTYMKHMLKADRVLLIIICYFWPIKISNAVRSAISATARFVELLLLLLLLRRRRRRRDDVDDDDDYYYYYYYTFLLYNSHIDVVLNLVCKPVFIHGFYWQYFRICFQIGQHILSTQKRAIEISKISVNK